MIRLRSGPDQMVNFFGSFLAKFWGFTIFGLKIAKCSGTLFLGKVWQKWLKNNT